MADASESEPSTSPETPEMKANCREPQTQKTEDAKLNNQESYNRNKYYVAEFDGLTETEKLQLARDLRALELKGVIEWRDSAWQLAANIASEETSDKTVERLGEQADVKWEIGAKYEVLRAGRGNYGVVATLVRIGRVSSGHGDFKSGLIFRDDSGKRIEVATLARVIRRVQ
jgi:hypothetical protein